MNTANIINLYATWYKGLNIYVSSAKRTIVIEDTLTKCVYDIHNNDMICRTFREIGNTRKICNMI